MTEAGPLRTPSAGQWTWGPERLGFGGYAGTCAIGPFEVKVSAKERHDDRWELCGDVKLAEVRTAWLTWEVDSLSCTPEGILAEIANRDVLSQLVETTRRRLGEATRLIEEFDVIARACDGGDAEL